MTTRTSSILDTLRAPFGADTTGRVGRRLAVIVLASAFGLASCGGGSDSGTDDTTDDTTETTDAPDDSSDLGWSLDVPGEWSETDPGVAQMMWMIADDMGSVNVLTEDFPEGTVIDLQGYLDAAIPQLSSFIDGAEVTDTSFVEGEHHTVAILDYTGSVESTFIWYRAVIALDDNATKAVIVTFATADESVYEAAADEVTEVALTLKID